MHLLVQQQETLKESMELYILALGRDTKYTLNVMKELIFFSLKVIIVGTTSPTQPHTSVKCSEKI
jgi:hypothetical protein